MEKELGLPDKLAQMTVQGESKKIAPPPEDGRHGITLGGGDDGDFD